MSIISIWYGTGVLILAFLLGFGMGYLCKSEREEKAEKKPTVRWYEQ